MSQGLPVSNLIDVTVTITPAGASFQNINSFLILGSSGYIDVVTRILEFGSITEVGEVFPTNSPEYQAAELWFSQQPAPQSLFIGEWAKAATSGQLFCAPLTATEQELINFTVITSGGFLVYLNGVPYAITGLNFSAATTLPGVASDIQTALAVDVSGTTCTWNGVNENFIIETAGSTGVNSTVSFLSPPTGVGSITFTGTGTNADTLTVDGTSIELVSGAPTGNEVQIGGTAALTAANMLAFLQGSADVNISKMTYTLSGTVIYCVSKIAGSAGDAYTLAKSSTAITLSGATLAGGNATDVSALVQGNASDSGAYVANGVAAETALAAVTLFNNEFSSQWYALTVLGVVDADVLAIAAFIEATTSPQHFYFVTTQEAGVLVAAVTSDIAYQLAQLDYNHTATQYSSLNPYAAVSMAARILTTNWEGSDTTITLMYKQEPGVIPENLNTQQAASAQAKQANVYVNYNNGTSILQYGTCASGEYVDTIIGLDWLANQIQTDVYNALYTSTTKVPQTDSGENILGNAIQSACAQGITNGLGAPGTWNSGGFGQLSEGDFLSKGYYIYQPPLALQPENLRAERESVAFQVAFKLAGAVQEANISVLVNQ